MVDFRVSTTNWYNPLMLIRIFRQKRFLSITDGLPSCIDVLPKQNDSKITDYKKCLCETTKWSWQSQTKVLDCFVSLAMTPCINLPIFESNLTGGKK